MPITWTSPLPGQASGPGFRSDWQSDFIGPLPTGSTWQVLFRERPPGETTTWSYTFETSSPIASTIHGQTPTGVALPVGSSLMPHLAQAQLTVQLLDPQLQILDQGSQDIIWDTVTASPYLLWQASGSGQTGGYVQADRDRDVKTNAAVIAALPLTELIGEIAELGLDSAFSCPPMNLLVRSNEQLLTGTGTVDRPSGSTGVNAYGFTFRVEVVPPGIGLVDGAGLEYRERLAQFLVIKVDADNFEYVSDRYEFFHDQERVCWGVPFPRRVVYSILPGVTLRFFWLVFKIGQ